MKRIILALILTTLAQTAFALDIVYPKCKTVTINATSTFFIGSSDPKKKLTINGQPVQIHPSGGFAYVVPLTVGGNNFNIKSGNEQLNFTITRPEIKQKSDITQTQNFKEYDNMRYAVIINENTPLRLTPVNDGINRISHLQKNIPVVIDGEQGNFYRVILGSNKTGWIDKSNIKLVDNGNSLAELKGYDYIDTNEFYIFVFHLSQMTPYELVENDPFLIKIFNIAEQPENTYIMKLPLAKSPKPAKINGYSARFSGTDLIVKVRKPIFVDNSKPLKGLKIAIDAGHGGNEIGAIGCLRDNEKDLNLAFAKQLEDELKKRGAEVFMTRTSDSTIELKDRIEKANEENAFIFISLHGNALPDGQDPNKRSGTSIYYYYPQAKSLAESILTKMVTELGMNNDKVHQKSFAVVRNTNALSILIEIGYLINPSDNAKMRQKDFQKTTAKAIANGIENYLTN